MRRASSGSLWLCVVSLGLGLVFAVWVNAQEKAAPKPPSGPVALCKASLTCLQTMVDDLRDYRQYLEDQLSLAKTLLGQANARISEQAKEIEALKAKLPPPEKK